jgi:DNA-binding NarL/FixJ family response regulator
VISYLRHLIPDHPIEVFGKVLYTLEAPEPVIIIDRSVVSDQPEYTFTQVRKAYPQCRIVLLSTNPPSDTLQPYLDESILLSDSEELVSKKLQKVYSDVSLSGNAESNHNAVSDRELEVLRLVALGMTNKEISDELCISTHTVITHRKNITAKLGIKTIAGLTVFAVINGIISADELNNGN